MQFNKHKKISIVAIFALVIVIGTSGLMAMKSNSMTAIQKINTDTTFIKHFNISESMQQYLKEYETKGYDISDIRISYAFLVDVYGKKEDLKVLLDKAKEGKKWSDIFKEYNSQHDEFTPRAFDTEYLDKIMKSNTITSDDIIICDRISSITGEKFETLISRNMEGEEWPAIGEGLGIINNQDSLSRVPITTKQIEEYKQGYGVSEDVIVNCFVIANKYSVKPEDILVKVISNQTQEEILEYFLVARFK